MELNEAKGILAEKGIRYRSYFDLPTAKGQSLLSMALKRVKLFLVFGR